MTSEKGQGPTLVVLAGPNGAGKSTFFDLYLRETGLRFVNADLIAAALPEDLDAKSRAQISAAAADLERRALVAAGHDLCMETVFSDPVGAKIAFLRGAQQAGYRVELVFIGLAGAELSQARVIQRVLQGGHDVPDEKLFERFPRVLRNLEEAITVVDTARIFDNSDPTRPYAQVARISRGLIEWQADPSPQWASRALARCRRSR